MLLIWYPRCGTCRKAKKWLDEHEVKYTERKIHEEPPTEEELKVWKDKSGLPLKKFFNTSGQLYRSMNLKEKLPSMSEKDMLKVLASDGMLVKRPILLCDNGKVLVGFQEEAYKDSI